MESALDETPATTRSASAFAPAIPTIPDLRGPALATILIRSGGKGQRAVPVNHSVTRLGRGPDNDLVLAAPSVSLAHAEIRLRDGVWLFGDLESEAGSWIDGTKVTEPFPIAPGSTLQLGDATLVFIPRDRAADLPVASPRMMLPEMRAVRRSRALWYVLAVIALAIAAYFITRPA